MIHEKRQGPLTANTLSDFITTCDDNYLGELVNIRLFDPAWTSTWDQPMRDKFVKVFYHLRGHFHDFLWILGNFAPDQARKEMVLANIGEEFGGERKSHEQLYIDFAHALGVDLLAEMITPAHQLPFVSDFNQQHHAWLLARDWDHKQAAFSAYERLDNLDYPKLLSLAESFQVSEAGLIFFKVHTKVTHFEVTEIHLAGIWAQCEQTVMDGFNFIYQHQLRMWRTLTQLMENYQNETIT